MKINENAKENIRQKVATKSGYSLTRIVCCVYIRWEIIGG